MRLRHFALPGLLVLAFSGSALADNVTALDPDQLAAKIDEFIAAEWKAKNITPAPIANDAEFIRRVYLDLTGRIPRVAEAREFLTDNRADKRQRLIDNLLKNPQYVRHLATTWRHLLLPQGNNQQIFA